MQCGLDLARRELGIDTLNLQASEFGELGDYLEGAGWIGAGTYAVHAVIGDRKFRKRLA